MDDLVKGISKCFHKPELINVSLLFEEREEDVFQFFRSHILKANFARIVGLLNLLKYDDIDNRGEIIEKLEIEAKELRQSLDEIKYILENFGNLEK